MPTADEVVIDGRRVTVWAPDAVTPTTPLLLCHDGQNILDGRESLSREGWHIDSAVMTLERDAGLPAPVIVAPWSSAAGRGAEYAPQAVVEASPALRASLRERYGPAQLRGDAYADWCADVLVPWAAARFGLDSSPGRVAVLGSSMGGLAALYALARHPGVYGAALALSTHWTLGGSAFAVAVVDALPPPGSRRIWMDHGSRGLDAEYEPFQLAANQALDERGWVEGRDYAYRAYPGADHNERAWAARVADALTFWLAPHGRLGR